jgi:hypothetical protein
LFSVVRPQKAAQQMINYAKSRIAETLSQVPISPWIAVEGQVNGYEAQWKNSNSDPKALLIYKAVDIEGKPAPPPQRQQFEPPIQAYAEFVAQEVDDLKATSGIFDASLGNQANETSGKAIQARQIQSSLSTMDYLDNLGRSFKQAGDIIAEIVPKIYDTEREIEILGEDEKQKVVTINSEHQDASGKTKHYKIADAKMSYVVTMARAYDSKRLETFDMLQQLVQSAPTLLPIFGDVMFQQSDMAGADIVAERFRKQLPPNLQEDKDGEQVPPQAQAQMQQLSQQNQQLNAGMQHLEKLLGQLQYEKQAKVVESQAKLQQIAAQSQADMALEKMKLENALTIAEVNTKQQDEQERRQTFADMQSQFHDQAHDLAMQKDAQAHQQELVQQNADVNSQQSAQDAAQSQEAQQQQAEAQAAQV